MFLPIHVPLGQANELFTSQFPAAACFQLGLKAVTEFQEVVGVEAGIIEHFLRKRSFSPVGFLIFFIQVDAKLPGKYRIKADLLVTKDAGSLHGVKQVDHIDTDIPL